MPGIPDSAVRTRFERPSSSTCAADTGPRDACSASNPSTSTQFRFTGYNKFLDPDGYPAVAPPWGTLNAIDLNTGGVRWQIPLGEYPELAAKGITNTGTENYGGPDRHRRRTGVHRRDELRPEVPRVRQDDRRSCCGKRRCRSAGNATPATYEVNGRQYVVIAAGGGKVAGIGVRRRVSRVRAALRDSRPAVASGCRACNLGFS